MEIRGTLHHGLSMAPSLIASLKLNRNRSKAGSDVTNKSSYNVCTTPWDTHTIDNTF